jgi:hypothetical protein
MSHFEDTQPITSSIFRIRESMQQFFSYPCRSDIARFYQRVAGSCSLESVQESFYRLSERVRNDIYERVWVEAGRPNTDDPQWGEHHTFDNMEIFKAALKRFVIEKYVGLNNGQRRAVHTDIADVGLSSNEVMSDLGRRQLWGSNHAWGNIPRLIDALSMHM